MRVLSSAPTALRRAAAVVVFSACARCDLARRSRRSGANVTADRVYSDAQAARGQQLYQSQCVDLPRRGARGRRRAAAGWRRIPLGLECAFARRSRRQDREDDASAGARQCVAAAGDRPGGVHVLRAGKFPAGQTDLEPGDARTDCVSGGSAASAASSAGASSFAVAGNLAQLMRGVTFPNANILFNVQVKDPGQGKAGDADTVRLRRVGLDGVLRMAGGRSGRAGAHRDGAAVPAARTALRKRTSPFRSIAPTGSSTPTALMDVGRAAYKAAQSRNVDAVEQGRRAAERDVRELPQGLSRRRQGRKHGRRDSMPMTRASTLQQRIEITATARSPTSCASDRRNKSIGSVSPCRGSRSLSNSRRFRMIISFIGGSR